MQNEGWFSLSAFGNKGNHRPKWRIDEYVAISYVSIWCRYYHSYTLGWTDRKLFFVGPDLGIKEYYRPKWRIDEDVSISYVQFGACIIILTL